MFVITLKEIYLSNIIGKESPNIFVKHCKRLSLKEGNNASMGKI
jgi:hypothetical protein